MSQKNPKPSPAGKPAAAPRPAASKPQTTPTPPPPAAPLGALPPLFRWVDWLGFAITFLISMFGYWWTLAPDLTLQDSGELAVASMYAGVPHPPGYPVWTLYTWLFTLLPISNIAYRVALSSAVAGAVSCGLIAMMISRGSSMLLEGISLFKTMDRKAENAFCVVASVVGGLLMAFNGFMWSQATIVEVYTLSVLSLTFVLICVMKWLHTPVRLRYLYLAFFWFGICFNNHQSLLVIAMALEIAVIAAAPRIGRELLFWNVVIFLGGLLLAFKDYIPTLKENPPVLIIFCLVGLASMVGWVILAYTTKKPAIEVVRDVTLVALLACAGLIIGDITSYTDLFDGKRAAFVLTCVGFLVAVAGFCCLTFFPRLFEQPPLGREWWNALACGLSWAIGCSFYIYMPLAGMSNPPLNWGYPRTVAGFIHAFTRGQYERIHPTTDSSLLLKQFDYTIIGGTIAEYSLLCMVFGLVLALWWVWRRAWTREAKFGLIAAYVAGLFLMMFLLHAETVAWIEGHRMGAVWLLLLSSVYVCMLPLFAICVNPTFLFWKEMQRRERAWMATITSMYIFLGPFLMVLLNPAPDRQAQELNKVFFTASHVLITMGIGYGVAMLLAVVKQWYEEVRLPLAIGLGFLTVAAVFGLKEALATSKYGLHYFTAIYALGLGGAALALVALNATRAPLRALMIILLLSPGYSVLSHWENNEQRGHLFGYWFGHDMFTPPFKGKDNKPLYPEMAKHAVLYGGTDPGRFNPTYMIFCESFIPKDKRRDPDFDRRDVYLITQNALADGTYLQYIRGHYNRSAQIDPPFFTELLRGNTELARNTTTNWIARLATPVDTFFLKVGDNIEKQRRAGSSFFEPTHFIDAKALAAKLKAGVDPVSKHVFSALSKETQDAIGLAPESANARSLLSRDLNRLLEAGPLFETNRFAGVALSQHVQWFVEENPQSHTRIRLNRLLLEEAYPKEISKSPGGVYPDREIKTATNEDSQRCFNEYIQDATKRFDHDQKNPAGQHQMRQGEDVRVINGRVQVSGQVAVMAINGLLTKVIFDANPNHEFYVEESFPLDWMYPHLTPFGIIMKLNRAPIGELTQDIVDRDHDFWSQFSTRLIGNWITYDTSIADICAFAERVYLQKDFRGYNGDRAFVRDNDGQKAFSKLRSSIGGLYAWRVQTTRNPLEQQRVLKEAEFSLKQSFAFCPYSPEAVFRYINILVSLSRFDDAILLSQTALKFDPANGQLKGLIDELERIKRSSGGGVAAPPSAAPAANVPPPPSAALQGLMKQIVGLLDAHQTNQAMAMVDGLLQTQSNEVTAMVFAAQVYNQMFNIPKAEQALVRYATLMGNNPEAWFDLAGMQALQNKTKEALASLKASLTYEAKRKAQEAGGPPSSPNDLFELAKTDPRFTGLRASPE
ncbi:MAG: DUF2723 domain-containing protein, partial [Verrucomicrobia bacterium]|nr:DUF2723 domain-containing protein [Verrucomicrobiota bacterium]